MKNSVCTLTGIIGHFLAAKTSHPRFLRALPPPRLRRGWGPSSRAGRRGVKPDALFTTLPLPRGPASVELQVTRGKAQQVGSTPVGLPVPGNLLIRPLIVMKECPDRLRRQIRPADSGPSTPRRCSHCVRTPAAPAEWPCSLASVPGMVKEAADVQRVDGDAGVNGLLEDVVFRSVHRCSSTSVNPGETITMVRLPGNADILRTSSLSVPMLVVDSFMP